jgi:AcrR family transcriptional regulator
MDGRVKPPRRYDATRRRERARLVQAGIVAAAEARFLSDGYAATTIATIAADAGVSVDTIYKRFGGKPGLIRAVHERALEGEGPVAAETRSDALQTSEMDPRAIVRGWGALSSEVAPRVAPVLLLVRDAAAADPELRRLQHELEDARLDRMTHNARTLHAGGHLRRGITLEHAAEVLWTYSSPELFELLVTRRGWTPARFGGFIAEAMIAALLDPA